MARDIFISSDRLVNGVKQPNPKKITATPPPTTTGLPPVVTTNPVITGSVLIGSLLSVDNGVWANSPDTFVYQWLRNGSPIIGANSNSYSIISTDVSQTLSCQVTASNVYGSASALSQNVFPIGVGTAAALKFNLSSNSQYLPLVAF